MPQRTLKETWDIIMSLFNWVLPLVYLDDFFLFLKDAKATDWPCALHTDPLTGHWRITESETANFSPALLVI